MRNVLISIISLLFHLHVQSQPEDWFDWRAPGELREKNQLRLRCLVDDEFASTKPQKLAELTTSNTRYHILSVDEASDLNIPLAVQVRNEQFALIYQYEQVRHKRKVCEAGDDLTEMDWAVGTILNMSVIYRTRECMLKHDHDFSSIPALRAELSRKKMHLKVNFDLKTYGMSGPNVNRAIGDINKAIHDKDYGELFSKLSELSYNIPQTNSTTIDPELILIY